jgi:hypothetical protein
MELQAASPEPNGPGNFVVESIDGGRTRRSYSSYIWLLTASTPLAVRIMPAGAIGAWPEGTPGAMRFGDGGLVLWCPGFEENG